MISQIQHIKENRPIAYRLCAEPTPVGSNVQVISLTGVFLQEWQLCLQLLHPEHQPVPSSRRGHRLIIQPVEDLCSKPTSTRTSSYKFATANLSIFYS